MSRGMFLEEFEVGKEYLSGGRTVTEADVANFAGLSGDFNPLHMDDEFAKTTVFGKRIAHGALGYIIATGLSNQTGMFEGTTIAFLEANVKYPAPLHIGATVHLSMVPTEVKKTSKPGRGILKMDVKLIDQTGTTVMDSVWTLMMKSRD